jgi:leucyl-tRNA synthetase
MNAANNKGNVLNSPSGDGGMEYNFRDIEKKWQQKWKESKAYKVENDFSKPKCYVLDMFPYPSGAGLHVGHPLGYIASDIYSRYKRLKGFNVLHPMGFDSFGLPAEQYALETGQHPAETTKKNIATFKSQLDKIGFCYDWEREVQTSDPKYYKWTQWIFLQLFNSYYDSNDQKAKPIVGLIKIFETEGSVNGQRSTANFFTADEWNGYSKKQQEEILMKRRLAFSAYGEVNWCEALGTVLANDEVVNGVSERGGHPVEKRKMRQWYLRITAYADRLLEGLETVDFSDSMKEMQRNWIGKSEGAEIEFRVVSSESGVSLRVYTTRPDTIFGVDFMVLAPEHELVTQITTTEQKEEVEKYISYVKSRSDRERQAEVKQITGCFTGAYAINPFDGREIPIWIAEYVLAGYGTGAIMSVPCGDQRDFLFAKHFNIPITNIIGEHYNGEEANSTKDAILQNSDFLNGLLMKDAIEVAIKKIEEAGFGKRKVNYKMRDAGFSRQRYWGEPFPIIWRDGVAIPLDAEELPLELPHVDKYGPGPAGEGPLANLKDWALIPSPSPQVEKGAARVPKYGVHTPKQYELAKEMRKGHTEAEGILWELVRDSKLGVKFRRQHPIESYIVDFVCLQEKLIVEVDGGYHDTEEQKKYDDERTKVLNKIGFELIRFSNEEVKKHSYKTKDKIKEKLAKMAELQNNSPLHLWRGVGGEGQVMRETNTMPGYAGSSWYFLRYMDPHNDKTFCDRKVSDYWNQVDLYIGGTEHAVGHLLYSRMWTKVLFDLGLIGFDEPYKKLVNQGMIQGRSSIAYRFTFSAVYYENGYIKLPKDFPFDSIFISKEIYNSFIDKNGELRPDYYVYFENIFDNYYVNRTSHIVDHDIQKIHIPVELVDVNDILNISELRSKPGFEKALFLPDSGSFICDFEIEKMSKRWLNVVNPDDIVKKYGADTFRMYEMFLGPVEMSKPWDTKGIEGVHRFLRKLWRLFYDEIKGKVWTEEKATDAELKVLHKTIKKIEEDTERFSFNTAVSAFMIATNELTDLKCHKRSVLEPLLILLTPYAPHIAEELYAQLRQVSPLRATERSEGWERSSLEGASILDASYPKFEEKYIKETTKTYPVAINGKTRTELTLALDATQQQVEEIVLKDTVVQKWLEGKHPKKIIYVKNKMINVVV